MLYTACFANLDHIKINEDYILISINSEEHKDPEWFDGPIYKRLSPTKEINSHTNPSEYCTKFINYLNTLSAESILRDLLLLACGADINNDTNIILITSDAPNEKSHRHMVANWLCKNNIPCEEID